MHFPPMNFAICYDVVWRDCHLLLLERYNQSINFFIQESASGSTWQKATDLLPWIHVMIKLEMSLSIRYKYLILDIESNLSKHLVNSYVGISGEWTVPRENKLSVVVLVWVCLNFYLNLYFKLGAKKVKISIYKFVFSQFWHDEYAPGNVQRLNNIIWGPIKLGSQGPKSEFFQTNHFGQAL